MSGAFFLKYWQKIYNNVMIKSIVLFWFQFLIHRKYQNIEKKMMFKDVKNFFKCPIPLFQSKENHLHRRRTCFQETRITLAFKLNNKDPHEYFDKVEKLADKIFTEKLTTRNVY